MTLSHQISVFRISVRKLVMVIFVLMSQQAQSVLPQSVRFNNQFIVEFSAGSSEIQASTHERVESHANCIKLTPNSVVIVVAAGDSISGTDTVENAVQIRLATQRANNLRSLFISQGINSNHIATEAHASIPYAYLGIRPLQNGGLAVIEYIGACYGLEEDLSKCREICIREH